MKIFLLFITLFSGLVLADDCSFAKASYDYVIENAEIDAKYSFESKGVYFIAVANGFAPASHVLANNFLPLSEAICKGYSCTS